MRAGAIAIKKRAVSGPLEPQFWRLRGPGDGTENGGLTSCARVKPGAYPWPNGGERTGARRNIHFFRVMDRVCAHGADHQIILEGDPLDLEMAPLSKDSRHAPPLKQLIARGRWTDTCQMGAGAYKFEYLLLPGPPVDPDLKTGWREPDARADTS